MTLDKNPEERTATNSTTMAFRPSRSHRALLCDRQTWLAWIRADDTIHITHDTLVPGCYRGAWRSEGWAGTMFWAVDLARAVRSPCIPRINPIGLPPSVALALAGSYVRRLRRHWRKAQLVKLGAVEYTDDTTEPVCLILPLRPSKDHPPRLAINAHVEAHLRTRFEGEGEWLLLRRGAAPSLPNSVLVYSVNDRLVAAAALRHL